VPNWSFSGIALVDAINRVIEEPSLASTMGEAGRERAVNHFSISAAKERFLSVYEALRPAG
jgi:glycosyltransferase involved in cell wall biosynthesis